MQKVFATVAVMTMSVLMAGALNANFTIFDLTKDSLEIADDFVGKSRCDELPVFGLREQRLLREMAGRPASQRNRVSAEWVRHDGRQFWMEVEIQDDPTNPERRIYLFHDVTEMHDLRRQLDGRGSFENLVGRSKPMLEVYRLIEELAAVDDGRRESLLHQLLNQRFLVRRADEDAAVYAALVEDLLHALNRVGILRITNYIRKDIIAE